MRFNPFGGFKSPLSIKKILSPIRKDKKITLRKIGWIALYSLIVFVFFVAFLFAWYSKDLPTPGNIAKRRPAQSTKIFDRTGETLLYETGEQRRTVVESEQLPDILKQATVSVEDKSFYSHPGFDVFGVMSAIFQRITNQTSRTRGGSTITQQYVKNALLHSERTLSRKLKELILAIELEVMYDKDEILTMYLNEIPYGGNTAGAEAASRMFYDKTAADLTLAQAATLAAIPQAPTYYSPYGTHTEDLIWRRDMILDMMVDQKYISEEEADAAKLEDTTTTGTIVKDKRENMLAPHFAMYVIEQAVEEFGEDKIQQEGMTIITTLDYDKQKMAEEAVEAGMAKVERYGGSNASIVAVDPKTGEILAMVGSKDYFDTEIDGNVNVADSLRQPGSSFKPYEYATLFKSNKYSPSTTLFDLKTDFGGGYAPSNYDASFEGPVNIRYALGNSLNIPAVKTLSLAGIDETIRTAEDLGITSLTERDRYGLSLALGAGEVSPIEMAGAYSVFANGGVRHDIKTILKIDDNDGKTIFEYKPDEDPGREVLNPEIAYLISHILSDNQARSNHMGSNSALRISGKNVAAKTGTTSDYRDAWTIGYTPSLAVAVWTGNNDNSEMKRGAAGLVVAAPIFKNFMTNALGEKEIFDRPSGIQKVEVDRYSNKLPTEHSPEKVTDIFASWQVPTGQDDIHVKVRVCKGQELLAPEGMPESLTEEKTYTNIHSQRPDNSNWEGPVRAWAEANGMANSAPTDFCEIGDINPKVSITLPGNNASVTGLQTVKASVTSGFAIKVVNFYIDDISIASDTTAPYETSYNFSGLSVGSHKITAIVTDENNSTGKNEINVSVPSDVSVPVISNVQTSQLTSTSMQITWETNEAATSQVLYGTAQDLVAPYSYTDSSTLDSTLVTSHNVTITVFPGVTYYFRAKSKDGAGNETHSSEGTFTTTFLAPPPSEE